MHRKIEFAEAAGVPSLGRNGRMTTVGTHAMLYDGQGRLGNESCVVLAPINSQGNVGRAEVSVDCEACGEVGMFLVEAFCRRATPEARAELLARLQAVCDGLPDPVRDAEFRDEQAAQAAARAEFLARRGQP